MKIIPAHSDYIATGPSLGNCRQGFIKTHLQGGEAILGATSTDIRAIWIRVERRATKVQFLWRNPAGSLNTLEFLCESVIPLGLGSGYGISEMETN